MFSDTVRVFQGTETAEKEEVSREQKAESRKQKAESREQKAESREQRAESREQKAESREQRAESREQKAESRKQKTVGAHNVRPQFSYIFIHFSYSYFLPEISAIFLLLFLLPPLIHLLPKFRPLSFFSFLHVHIPR